MSIVMLRAGPEKKTVTEMFVFWIVVFSSKIMLMKVICGRVSIDALNRY